MLRAMAIGLYDKSSAVASSATMALAMLLMISWSCFAELQIFSQPAKRDGTLSFLVVGDWGRRGTYNQSQVAFQMGRIGEKLDIDFVISNGDNFYDNGLTGVDDPAFQESFTDIYTAKSLQKQWYSVLGNHDYRGNVEAQLDPILRKLDSRWFCMRSYVVNADTSPFADQYFENPGNHSYDWSGVLPQKAYLTNLLKDLDLALRQSTANWKVVVGHHGIRSAGQHGDTSELVEQLLPLLKANDVDFYINGHDHCLQHISSSDSPIQFLTSGGGSKAWRGDTSKLNKDGMHLYYDGQGFMSVELSEMRTQIVFYDIFGEILHKWTVTKPLLSAI